MRANRIHYVHARLVMAVLAFGFSALAMAQGSAVHLLRAPATVTPGAIKSAIHAVRALDESAMISVDGDLMKVRLDPSVSRARLLEALNSEGAGYASIEEQRATDAAAMPSRIDTGDPLGDDARYDAAKRAWIERYPESYRAISNGASEHGAGTKTR